MATIPVNKIDGDLTLGRNLAVGGDANVAGNATVEHDLKVKGWLEAPNIRGAFKGLFVNEAQLKAAYPEPEQGWMALVGTSLPAALYVYMDGEWKPTGGTGGDPTADLGSYENTLNGMKTTLEAVTASVDRLGKTIQFTDLDSIGAALPTAHNKGTYPLVTPVMEGIRCVGILLMFSDSNDHQLTQVFVTHYILNEEGVFSAHEDSKVRMYVRSYGINNNDFSKSGEWTDWRNLALDWVDDMPVATLVNNGLMSSEQVSALANLGIDIKNLDDEDVSFIVAPEDETGGIDLILRKKGGGDLQTQLPVATEENSGVMSREQAKIVGGLERQFNDTLREINKVAQVMPFAGTTHENPLSTMPDSDDYVIRWHPTLKYFVATTSERLGFGGKNGEKVFEYFPEMAYYKNCRSAEGDYPLLYIDKTDRKLHMLNADDDLVEI